MKSLRHYKFISSIRIGVVPALQLLGEAVAGAAGRALGAGDPLFPQEGDWAGPTPSARTISSVAPGSWAESSGVVFMWQSKAPSGIPGDF